MPIENTAGRELMIFANHADGVVHLFRLRLIRTIASLSLRKLAQGEQLRPSFKPPLVVHLKNGNGGSSPRRSPDNTGTAKLEVLGPDVFSWVKDWDGGRSLRINSRQIRSLACVAAIAGQREVGKVIGPAVLFRGDVLDVVREPGLLLAKEAVFTAVTGSRADKLPRL
jgi:hypothetical protein